MLQVAVGGTSLATGIIKEDTMTTAVIPVLVGVIALVAVACGQQAASEVVLIPTVTPTPMATPEITGWSENDVRAALRDYLVGLQGSRSTIEGVTALSVIVSLPSWVVSYNGQGWWQVEGNNLGQGLVAATVTPTVVPKQFKDVGLNYRHVVMGLCSGGEPDEKIDALCLTLTPNPPPSFIQGLRKGVWVISEQTGSVVPQNDAAAKLLACVFLREEGGVSEFCGEMGSAE